MYPHKVLAIVGDIVATKVPVKTKGKKSKATPSLKVMQWEFVGRASPVSQVSSSCFSSWFTLSQVQKDIERRSYSDSTLQSLTFPSNSPNNSTDNRTSEGSFPANLTSPEAYSGMSPYVYGETRSHCNLSLGKALRHFAFCTVYFNETCSNEVSWDLFQIWLK